MPVHPRAPGTATLESLKAQITALTALVGIQGRTLSAMALDLTALKAALVPAAPKT